MVVAAIGDVWVNKHEKGNTIEIIGILAFGKYRVVEKSKRGEVEYDSYLDGIRLHYNPPADKDTL